MTWKKITPYSYVFICTWSAAPKGLDAINNEWCRYIYIRDLREIENYRPVPKFYNKDLGQILRNVIESSAPVGVE
jgi:hypothetical protein